MTTKKVNSGIRLATMVLDHLLMTMIAMLFFIPSMISNFTDTFNISHELATNNSFDYTYIALLGFAIYFCKDCINGRSIAKLILKLQIVDNTTGQVASPLKCFIRNIFCIIWPVEFIVALINPGRRIGDRVAGTKLIPFDPTLKQPKPNFTHIALALALAYGLIFLIMLPFNSMKSNWQGQEIKLVESSLNNQESKAVEKLFADSLGQILTADVRVYDKIQNEDLKYVSLILQLKEDYMADDKAYDQLQSATVPLLLSMFPEKTFVGRIQYIYQTNSSMHRRILILDWRTEN